MLLFFVYFNSIWANQGHLWKNRNKKTCRLSHLKRNCFEGKEVIKDKIITNFNTRGNSIIKTECENFLQRENLCLKRTHSKYHLIKCVQIIMAIDMTLPQSSVYSRWRRKKQTLLSMYLNDVHSDLHSSFDHFGFFIAVVHPSKFLIVLLP